jgi:hypothetical protein
MQRDRERQLMIERAQAEADEGQRRLWRGIINASIPAALVWAGMIWIVREVGILAVVVMVVVTFGALALASLR